MAVTSKVKQSMNVSMKLLPIAETVLPVVVTQVPGWSLSLCVCRDRRLSVFNHCRAEKKRGPSTLFLLLPLRVASLPLLATTQRGIHKHAANSPTSKTNVWVSHSHEFFSFPQFSSRSPTELTLERLTFIHPTGFWHFGWIVLRISDSTFPQRTVALLI